MKPQILFFRFCSAVLSSFLFVSQCDAGVITAGAATIQFDTTSSLFAPNPGFFGLSLTLDRYYGVGTGADTATAMDIANGTGGIAIVSGPSVNLVHVINGASAVDPTGRDRQTTNADLDITSPLTTWSASERIGLDGVTRFDIGGSPFVLGDYSLSYSAGTNTLSITNNFAPAGEAFRVIAPTVSTTVNGFVLSGDLRLGNDMAVFGYTPGDDVGFITLNAFESTTAVPEPSSFAVLAFGGIALSVYRKRRSVVSSALNS